MQIYVIVTSIKVYIDTLRPVAAVASVLQCTENRWNPYSEIGKADYQICNEQLTKLLVEDHISDCSLPLCSGFQWVGGTNLML